MRSVAVALLVVAGVTPLTTHPATAWFINSASGAGTAHVATLAPPDPPQIPSSGIQSSFCTANVTWPAPPAGASYRVRRTIGMDTVTVAGPFTTAGILSDSVPLSSLDGPLSYSSTWSGSPTRAGPRCRTRPR